MVKEGAMAQIGFIGVGNMGLGMAANLVKAGHSVVVYDKSDQALAQAIAAGCTAANSIAQAVAQAGGVVSMLPAGAHVREAYLDHVLEHAAPAAVLMDCSTIAVEDARSIIGAAALKGFTMVDAPVSGGVGAAQAGTLTFMVGGAQEAFARALPILQAMGKTVVHAGSAGAGQAAKICNNMLLAISMIGTCEAFNLAQNLGLDVQTFFDIASKASGQCWSMTSYCPAPGPVPAAPANRGYEGGFSTALMLKDLKLAQQAAQMSHSTTPLGAQAEALYAAFADNGGAQYDFSAIIKFLKGNRPGQ
jgi:3-hydroxyisobutyrate dehydrogenase